MITPIEIAQAIHAGNRAHARSHLLYPDNPLLPLPPGAPPLQPFPPETALIRLLDTIDALYSLYPLSFTDPPYARALRAVRQTLQPRKDDTDT
jgi:hypothetical protein